MIFLFVLPAAESFCLVCIRQGYFLRSSLMILRHVSKERFSDGLVRRSERFGLCSTDSRTTSTTSSEWVLGHPEWLGRSSDCVKVLHSPISLKFFTQSAFLNLFGAVSKYIKKRMKFLLYRLVRGAFIVMFDTENPVLEHPAGYLLTHRD